MTPQISLIDKKYFSNKIKGHEIIVSEKQCISTKNNKYDSKNVNYYMNKYKYHANKYNVGKYGVINYPLKILSTICDKVFTTCMLVLIYVYFAAISIIIFVFYIIFFNITSPFVIVNYFNSKKN